MKEASQQRNLNFQKLIEISAVQLSLIFLGLVSFYFSIQSTSFGSRLFVANLFVGVLSFMTTVWEARAAKHKWIQIVLWTLSLLAHLYFFAEILKHYGVFEFWNRPEVFVNLAILFVMIFSSMGPAFSFVSWFFCWAMISWVLYRMGMGNATTSSDLNVRGPASLESVSLNFFEFLPLNKIGLHTLGLGGLFSVFSYLKKRMNEILSVLLTGRSQKMASLGALSASLGHELSTPLTSLKGFTQILKESQKIQGDTDLNGVVMRLEHNINRMIEITRALKGFTQSATEHREVSVAELIDDIAILFEHHLKSKKIDFKINCDSKSKTKKWKCDRVEVGQILFNLISNARDALNDCETKLIHIDIVDTGEFDFVINVLDSGFGVEKVNQEKIFEPEFTTKAFGEGSGLGLWLSQSLAEKNHLILELQDGNSQLGGANFRLRKAV